MTSNLALLSFTLDFTSKDRQLLLKMANEVINKVHDEVPNGIMKVESAMIVETEPVVMLNLGVRIDKTEKVRQSLVRWWEHYGTQYDVLPKGTGGRGTKASSRPGKKWWQFWK